MTVRGIHIPSSTDSPLRWVPVERDNLDSWKRYIGDAGDRAVYVEALNVGAHRDALHLDEDGKRKGLAINARATVLGHGAGMAPTDVVVGDALVVGYDDEGDAAEPSVTITRAIGTLLGEDIRT